MNLIYHKRKLTDIFKRNRTKQNGKRLKSFVLGCHEAINDFNLGFKKWKNFLAQTLSLPYLSGNELIAYAKITLQRTSVSLK